MSELLPYEGTLADELQNLPLPDENMAWADMKRRLDEDDDNIAPVWWRGCLPWGLLALLLLVAVWFFVKQEKNNTVKQTTEQASNFSKQENKPVTNTQSTITTSGTVKDTLNKANTDTTVAINASIKNKLTDSSAKTSTIINATKKSSLGNYTDKQNTVSKTSLAMAASGKIKMKTAAPAIENNSASQMAVVAHRKITKQKFKKPGYKKIKNSNGAIDDITGAMKLDNQIHPHTIGDDTEKDNNLIKNDDNTVDPVIKQNNKPSLIAGKDSIQKIIADTTKKKNEQAKNTAIEKKKDSTLKKHIWFSAGIAMNQQLPIAGQKLTSYNSEGRKGNLADYIPSVYARMYKGNKWFIQAEFRYGAPQYNKDIVYQQSTSIDSINGNRIITDSSSRLKKTYYNQLPVTFNYFVLPNWSVGGGFIWNKFTSAISQLDIHQHDAVTNKDTLYSAITNPKSADSNFVSSYFQYVLETQYRWKKLSLGIRYTFGLQPYLKFTLPGSTEQKEKNQSFLLFIRYELWQSKRK